jgi:hypothetical protein
VRGDVSLRTREALGNRPTPLRGSAFNGWTWAGRWAEVILLWRELRLEPVPEVTVPGTEIAVVERRKAFPWPLFFEDGKHAAALIPKARLSAFRLPLIIRGRSPETTTHAKGFCGQR